jgi:murein DD-endopeptidase MepM/ murein hydrolase activator NlpD
VAVEKGQRVAPGQALGSVGKGGGERYLAHLHFEIQKASLPALYWPGKSKKAILENYLDPAPILAATGVEHRYVWGPLIINLQKPDVPQIRPPKEGEV